MQVGWSAEYRSEVRIPQIKNPCFKKLFAGETNSQETLLQNIYTHTDEKGESDQRIFRNLLLNVNIILEALHNLLDYPKI